MNGYERIKSTLAGHRADKVPVMLHNFMMIAKEAGYTMEQYRNDPKIMAACYIQAIETYQYDGVLIDLDTVTLAGACGVPVDLPISEPARSHKGIMETIDDFSALQDYNMIKNYKYVEIWCEAVRILKDYFKNEIYVRGNCDQAPFSLATMLRGPENLMIDLCLEDEDKIMHLLNYCYNVSSNFISLMAATGADMVSNGDSTAGPAMLSPQMYAQFALPYEKRIVEYSHKLGLAYTLHICGNTDLIINDMITTGADAVELDYKTDIVLAEQAVRGKTVFIGNIDPSNVLCFGSADLVKQKTEALLNQFVDNPRFILNAGCAISPLTPSENIKAMIAVARS